MCLPRALNYKPHFRGLSNKFLLDVSVPSSIDLSQGSLHTPHPTGLCLFPPEPVILDWVLVSDKRQHLPACAKQGSDNPSDRMKLLAGLRERKVLYEGSLL